MRPIFHILPLVLAANAFAEMFPDQPQYLNSRTIILSFQTANSAEIERVRVWVLTDDGGTWTEATVAPSAANAVRFNAGHDGNYSFYLVLENEGGRSADAPSTGAKPHARVIVDTAPPTLQIHQARRHDSPGGDPQVQLNVSLVDENLGENGVRLFYRSNTDASWQDGGPVIFAHGIVTWQPAADIGPTGDLRLVVTDLAGNQASDETQYAMITQASGSEPAAAVGPSPAASATTSPLVLGPASVPPIPSVIVEPVPAVTLGDEPEAIPTTQPSPEAARQSQLLREEAARYLAEGRLSLAGARLQDAIGLTPADPNVLVDLGDVLYRTHQYDEAARRFRSALEASPDHAGAIEGLALVAAAQNRYPQARSYLQHLLRLSPESVEHWLHYGDVEHLLGNTAEARAAWEKVLKIESADEQLREKAQKRLRLFGQDGVDVRP
jgi:TolA-binding protein